MLPVLERSKDFGWKSHCVILINLPVRILFLSQISSTITCSLTVLVLPWRHSASKKSHGNTPKEFNRGIVFRTQLNLSNVKLSNSAKRTRSVCTYVELYCLLTVYCTETILQFCVSALCSLRCAEITNYSCHACEYESLMKRDPAFVMIQWQQNIIASVYLVVEVCFSLQPLFSSNFGKLKQLFADNVTCFRKWF